MAVTSDDVYRLFAVKRFQVEMMADRGVPITLQESSRFLQPTSQQPTGDMLADFVRHYTGIQSRLFRRDELTVTYVGPDGNLIHVFYAPSTKEKQGVGVISSFVKDLEAIGATTGIFITAEGLTPEAKRSLKLITKPDIQIFLDKQMLANPIRHVMVPSQRRLSPAERIGFFRESKLKPKEVIAISIDDPIVRYYDWKVGDIIEVDRINVSTSKTMTTSSIAYRMVSRIRFDTLKAPVKPKKPTAPTTTS